jgi:aminobenzoyl-glutamate transport protein
MPPLGALMFLAVGRHPVAGLLAAIAGVGCGFTANLLIVTTDVLLSGISTEAAKTLDGSLHVSVIDNWYFMASSVIVLTLVGGLITDKLIEPRLGTWEGRSEDRLEALTPEQRFGLRVAGIASLVFIALVAIMVVPQNGILRDPVTHTVMPSPFIKGIVPLIIFSSFRLAGLRYCHRENSSSGGFAAVNDRTDERDGRVYRHGVPAGPVCCHV